MNNVWPLQAACDTFYGNPRGGEHYSAKWAAENLTHVLCPWSLHMGSINIPFITIHRKCAGSLQRVLESIWEGVGKSQAEIDKLHYSQFSGSFNYRPKRGMASLSMHAYGCAIDWDAPENQQHSRHALFRADALLVVKFQEENWIWGGQWSDPDAMHVQAARVHD